MDTRRPLATIIAVTAAAAAIAQVLPASGDLRGVALLLDVVPFASVVVATVILAFAIRRARVPGARALVALYGYFAGALIGALGAAHLLAVVVAAIERARQHASAYDFRLYSLVLLGVLLSVTGLKAAMSAPDLARGAHSRWRESLWGWLAILAINLPLAPLQGFAVGFSVLASVALILLVGMRRRLGLDSAGEV